MRRRSSMKVIVAAAVMTVGLQGVAQAVIVGPGPAPGSDKNAVEFTGEYASTLKGSYAARAGKFKGTLTSAFSNPGALLSDSDASRLCVVGRKVEVFKDRSRAGKPDLSMGTDQVDENGNWAVAESVTRGRYYAKVGKTPYLVREYYGVNEYALCLADKSPEIRP